MATILYNNQPAVRPARALNKVLNELLRDKLPTVAEPTQTFVPLADILESEQGFEVHLAVPGVPKEDMKIDFQDGNLVISGERKAPVVSDNGPTFRRMEMAYGTFTRSFRLPETVEITAIEAQLTHGVLRLKLPFDSKKVTKHHIGIL
ncbi:Hsp20/alpha crystallin family protein [Hymenobacter elongatus]|uniref:Hsp20/alpha crystallin family protein n=1 Tax=Hymenobacter elongatus TaxID=877208 RepID=A0A4Z0PTX3_9BACT|nr:Hsp20/alpha crystallin family protein [Hymenobacter elongatus]TGE19852.1 Hsp20/alpha crystallin family protein [Hymenobacter elongatus]